MNLFRKLALAILISPSLFAFAQPLRIMPLGNSITYDSNSGDNIIPRPAGQRISYRYHLSQLLQMAGYSFDFVGSENAGNDYFQNTELDDNAGFPGIEDGQLANLILTGYNQYAGQYEAPGPYLLYYQADVILLEIGTNNLNESPNDVKQLLDNIRLYDQHVLVLVSRIINRKVYSLTTTQFNNNVESMVLARNDPKIIMVNLETGAGINYTTDMADDLHPNTTGYNKMAAKWFEALDNLNTKPVITTIPAQHAMQGSTFTVLNLDNYITDQEDVLSNITWIYKAQANTKFAVSIDGSRRLHLSVSDASWYGSEKLWLKAMDTGNGSFRKSDSVQITIAVDKSNVVPVISSEPVVSADEDNNYNYLIEAFDDDSDALTYSVIKMPAWMSFSSATHILCGRPANCDVGTDSIEIMVSDGKDTIKQNYILSVKNVNDPPVVVSVPETSVKAKETYQYDFAAEDVDLGDILTYSVISIPKWMSFASTNNGGLLFGVPDTKNIGPNSVILKVSDGHVDLIHGFTLMVTVQSALENLDPDEPYSFYPNPAHEKIYLKIPRSGDKKFMISSISGVIMMETTIRDMEEHEFDISAFGVGLYLFTIESGDNIISGKFTKSSF